MSDEKDHITKKPDSRFWIGYSNNSGLKAGLILCHSCPIDCCKNVEVNISVTNVDAHPTIMVDCSVALVQRIIALSLETQDVKFALTLTYSFLSLSL